MTEERKIILQMVQEGTLTVEEAEQLLSALEPERPAADTALAPRDGYAPRRLTVRVSENGRDRVNVRIPFSLVKVGLKLGHGFGMLGARYAHGDWDQEITQALSSLDIDELMDSILDGDITLPYIMVDVEDVEEDGRKYHVLVVLE